MPIGFGPPLDWATPLRCRGSATMPADARRPGPGEPLLFGPFQLDRRAGRLLRGSEAIALRPKTWAVLVYLADHRGALISRDELMDAVWPDVAVTPDTLTKSIGELRQALGDDPRSPRWIETVHRRGFRFIAGPHDDSAPEPSRRQRGDFALVGRDPETARLHGLFEEARAGRRQTVLVTGEPGAGKTSVVDAFLDDVRADPRAVLIGRSACIEQHGIREPYLPVLDALERLVRGAGGGEVLDLLRASAPTWLSQMPWIAGAERQRGTSADEQPANSGRMLREFAALTERLGAKSPVVVVLEDLHWSDPSTVDLLSYLAARPEAARLMIVGTYRPVDIAVHDHVLGPAARTLLARGQAVEIPLHELHGDDVERYLEQRFPGASFAAALARALHQYTDGNPLFMVATIDHLVSRGMILETSPGWTLTFVPGRDPLPLPEAARQVIGLQLDSLTPADRRLIEAASAVGSVFAVPVLAAALGASEDETESRCEELARGHHVLRGAASQATAAVGTMRQYAFTHELYREPSYDRLEAGRRQRLHRRIAEALESFWGERAEEIATTLAMHFSRAGEPRSAVRYLRAAAETARQRFAGAEAVAFLDEALAQASALPADRDRDAVELDLRLRLAAPLADIRGFASEDVLHNFERAHVLCRRIGTARQQFQIAYGLLHLHVTRADSDAPAALVAELTSLADRLATPEHRLLVDSVLVRVAISGGAWSEACRLGASFVAAHRAAGAPEPLGFGVDAIVAAETQYAVAARMVGDGGRARATIEEGLARAEGSGAPFTIAQAHCFAAVLAALSGDPAAALAHAERSHSIAVEKGYTQWLAPSVGLRGWARAQLGDRRAGIADLEEARAGMRGAHTLVFFTLIASLGAEAHLLDGSAAGALAALDEGFAVAESTRERLFCSELWRLEGEALLAAEAAGREASTAARRRKDVQAVPRPARGDAESCLRRALELAQGAGAHALSLRAAKSLARLWHAQGRAADARALLERHRANVVFDADDPELSEVAALARRPSSPRRPGSSSRG